MRLDHLLVHHLDAISRSALLKLILDGSILVEDLPRKAGYRVRSGETVSGIIPAPQTLDLAPEEIFFPIIFEDEHILVLVKPPGLVVHPAAGHRQGTLAHGLLHHCASLPGMNDERPGIVHRLDKDTSGIMLVAKTEQALQQLTKDFSNRRISKMYHALLLRSPSADEGRVVAAIGRHPVHRKKMAVRQDGRFAATGWQIRERFTNGMCFAELVLETGRTHQIRVHMASLGCPVAGDQLYGGKVGPSYGVAAARQMLHASTLVFFHPESGRELSFFAPLWADMAGVLQQLRSGVVS